MKESNKIMSATEMLLAQEVQEREGRLTLARIERLLYSGSFEVKPNTVFIDIDQYSSLLRFLNRQYGGFLSDKVVEEAKVFPLLMGLKVVRCYSPVPLISVCYVEDLDDER